MNIWVVFFIIVPPLIVFSAKPELDDRWRAVRLLLCTAVGYILINIAFWKLDKMSLQAVWDCQERFEHAVSEMAPECVKYSGKMIGVRQVAIVFFTAYIPASLYTLFWEKLWRRKYKPRIASLGHDFTGNYYSNIALVFFYPFVLSLPLLNIYIEMYYLYGNIFDSSKVF